MNKVVLEVKEMRKKLDMAADLLGSALSVLFHDRTEAILLMEDALALIEGLRESIHPEEDFGNGMVA